MDKEVGLNSWTPCADELDNDCSTSAPPGGTLSRAWIFACLFKLLATLKDALHEAHLCGFYMRR